MTRKIPFIINVLLAVLLTFILFSMHTKLAENKPIKRKSSEYVFPKVERPSAVISEGLGKIFDTDRSVLEAANNRKAVNGSGEALNELIAGDEIIRVQGIFLTEDAQFAVISTTGKKKRKKPEVFKISTGETLKGFRVTLIEQDAVHLSGPSSQTVVLRIFTRDES